MVVKVSINGERFILLSSPMLYFLVKIGVAPNKNTLLPPFTGKAVKSLLMKANPSLETIFEPPTQTYSPKPIKITPFTTDDKVYMWVRHGSNKVMEAKAGETLYFYIGFKEHVAHLVFQALEKLIDGVQLFNTEWRLTEFTEILKAEIPVENPPLDLTKIQAITVELKTPAKLIDPYKKTPYGRFLPVAGFLFAYNIGDIVSSKKKREKDYWHLINIANAVLQETHSAPETIKRVFYIYKGKPLPGLYGYIKYHICHNTLTPETNTLLANTILHAQIMGIGSGRATGFGHIKIKTQPTNQTHQEKQTLTQ